MAAVVASSETTCHAYLGCGGMHAGCGSLPPLPYLPDGLPVVVPASGGNVYSAHAEEEGADEAHLLRRHGGRAPLMRLVCRPVLLRSWDKINRAP